MGPCHLREPQDLTQCLVHNSVINNFKINECISETNLSILHKKWQYRKKPVVELIVSYKIKHKEKSVQ